MKTLVSIVLLIVLSLQSKAQLQLPKVFGSNMVLQRNVRIRFWGQASKNESIVLSIGNRFYECKTDSNGSWKLTTDSMRAGGHYLITIVEKNNGTTVAERQFHN